MQQMHASIKRNPHALISLARIKTADNYTYLHSMAVCALMMALAQRMQMSEEEVRLAGLAGLLHDVGKCRVPLHILNKPGALTPEEWLTMQDHSRLGAQLLRPMDVPDLVLQACLQHHEKMDGSGYPGKLKGTQIHPLSRMTAICDIYDAVTSDRPYKKRLAARTGAAAWLSGAAIIWTKSSSSSSCRRWESILSARWCA